MALPPNPNQYKFVIKDHSHKVSIFFLALESNFVCLAMEYYMLDLFVQRVNGAYWIKNYLIMVEISNGES